MRNFRVAAVILLIPFILSCTKSKILSPDYPFPYLPLAIGMTWEYESPNYTLSRSITGASQVYGGGLWCRLESVLLPKDTLVGDTAKTTFIVLVKDQLRECLFEGCFELYNVLLEYPLQIGESWLKYSSGGCTIGP